MQIGNYNQITKPAWRHQDINTGVTMKKALKIAALVLSLSVFSAAHAEMDQYVGVNVSRAQYDETGFPTANPTAVSVKLGGQLSPNFAFETRVGKGISEGNVTYSGTPISIKIDSFFGVYLKGILPVNPSFAPYALVGYTRGSLTAKAGRYFVSSSDSDVSYGIGADFPFTKSVSLNLEWARLLTGVNYKIEALSLGVAYKF